MNRRHTVIALLTAFTGVAFAGPLDKAWIKGLTDKCPIEYKVGEEMVFTLTPMEVDGEVAAGEYYLAWKRSGDDGIVDAGKEPFDGKTPFVYRAKIDRPGFVRFTATLCAKDGKQFKKPYLGDTSTPEGKKAMNAFEKSNPIVFFDGSAGADVEKLETEGDPADFDEFWAGQYKRLDMVPIEAKVVPAAKKSNAVDIYAVSVECAGTRPVTGYLMVPKAAAKGEKFPCRLTTWGYNGCRAMHECPSGGRTDEVVFDVNPFGLKLREFGGTEADRKALWWDVREGTQYGHGFSPERNEDPETAFFNGMVLRVKRALQYLKTRPEWNGRDLYASGGSQGGLQTIWAAGCGEGVTKAFSVITWCCDIKTNGGVRKDAANKWASDGWYIGWVPALGYYDAAIFAKRIPKTCYTEISRAGLGDYCCPPMGLMKMWNGMTCPKEIVWVQGSRHGYVPPAYDGRDTVRTVK